MARSQGYLAARSRDRGAATRRFLAPAAVVRARIEVPDRADLPDQPDRPRAGAGDLLATVVRAVERFRGPGRTGEKGRPRGIRRPGRVAEWASRALQRDPERRPDRRQSGEAGTPGRTRLGGAGTPGRSRPHGAETPGQNRQDGAGTPVPSQEYAAGTPGRNRPRGAGTPGRGWPGEAEQLDLVSWRSQGAPGRREAWVAVVDGCRGPVVPSRVLPGASPAGTGTAGGLPLVPGGPGIPVVPAHTGPRSPATRDLPVLLQTPACGHRGECRAGPPASTRSSGSAPVPVPGESVRLHLARGARPRPL